VDLNIYLFHTSRLTVWAEKSPHQQQHFATHQSRCRFSAQANRTTMTSQILPLGESLGNIIIIIIIIIIIPSDARKD
jgi:hypothetical protein